MIPPYNKLIIEKLDPFVILKAGERRTLGGLYGDPPNTGVHIDIINGTIKLYAMGWIRYADGQNVTRETRFCRIWNASERRFGTVDNPDYEYAD
jgi:hypothetical protein